VWPHDNAIIAAGLRRYGFVDEAHRLIDGVLAASTFYDGHLPELLGGIDRRVFAAPVDYTAASIPQAWAAGSVFSFVRTLLGLDPDIPNGTVAVEPRLPEWCRFLEITGVPMAGGEVAISATRDGRIDIDGLPAGVVVGPGRATTT
jgi:glycogen debranching enzyme